MRWIWVGWGLFGLLAFVVIVKAWGRMLIVDVPDRFAPITKGIDQSGLFLEMGEFCGERFRDPEYGVRWRFSCKGSRREWRWLPWPRWVSRVTYLYVVDSYWMESGRYRGLIPKPVSDRS